MAADRVRTWLLLLVALIVLTMLPPSARAAHENGQLTADIPVQGQIVLPGGAPAARSTVWYAPLTASGAFDWAQARGISLFYNTLNITVPGPGSYGLEIDPPENETSARTLVGYTFTVNPGATGVDLGTITLPTAYKRIVGTLALKTTTSSTPLKGVSVYAFNRNQQLYRSTRTRNDGSFGFGVMPGEWEVFASNVPGARWQVVEEPITIRFTDDQAVDERQASLAAEPTVGELVGRVVQPDGSPLPLPSPGSGRRPYVYVYGQRSYSGRYEYIDATGAFTVPVTADSYELEVVIDEQLYPDLIVPPPSVALVESGAVDLGAIILQRRNAVVAGVVRDDAGPIAGATVEAYREGGNWQSVVTDADGAYRFKLTDGPWNLSVFPEPARGYLQQGSFAQVVASAEQPVAQDFALTRAAAIVEGSFYEKSQGPGTQLPDVRGWAYARDEQGRYVAWDFVYLGGFSLNVPAGKLRIGALLEPGSDYSLQSEQDLAALRSQLASAGELSGAEMDALELAPFERELVVKPAQSGPTRRQVGIELVKNDAEIVGTVRDSATGSPVLGVPMVVSVTPELAAGAAQWASVDPATGTFAIRVAAGAWRIASYIEEESDSPYVVPWDETLNVTVATNGTATADIKLTKRDGIVAGTLTSGGTPLAEKLIWVSGETYTDAALTDENGEFSIAVPLREADGRVAAYTLGTDLECRTPTDCYYDIPPRPAVVTSASGQNGMLAQALNTLEAKPSGRNNATLNGLIVDSRGNALGGQAVKNGDRGGISSAERVDSDSSDDVATGNPKTNFSIKITYPQGQRPQEVTGRLKIAGSSRDIPATAIKLLFGEEQGRAVGAQQADSVLTFEVDPFAGLPVVAPAEFDARNGFSATLEDGTRIEIPPGAVPLESNDRYDNGQAPVRITIQPTYNIFASAQFGEAAPYGFEVTLTAVRTNRRIAEELLAPMQMTLRYSDADLVLNSTREAWLRAARDGQEEWEPATSFAVDPVANKVTFQTTELGTWALVYQRTACDHCLYLPMMGRR